MSKFDFAHLLGGKSGEVSFTNPDSAPKVHECLKAFERFYFARRAKTPESLTTWEIDYCRVFKNLPLNAPMSADVLLACALNIPPDTRQRQRYCLVLGALAKFLELPINLKLYRGSHRPKPRTLPDDFQIRQQYNRITNPEWRWAYGIIATYGIRPHELFHLDYRRLESGDVALKILRGKTGARITFPLYPEWFDEFNLSRVNLPQCTGKCNADLGNRVTRAFARLELPFPAYALRHCWAIRSLEFGLDLSLAAQQMGHSVAVHTTQYHAWISERQHRKAYDALLTNPSRPQPPEGRA